MTWKQIKAEALRIVDEVAQRKSDLELTEYQNKGRYRADYPAGMTMRDHNAIVREAVRRGISAFGGLSDDRSRSEEYWQRLTRTGGRS